MLPCTGLVRWYIPFLMQIVPISIRFRQNVLQFSNDPGKIPKIFKRTQNNHENFQQRFSNIKKCKIERGFVRLPKMNSKFPNTHVYDCNSKWRWNFRRWLKMRGWKFPSSFANHTKSKTIQYATIFQWRWKILPSVLHKRWNRKCTLQNHFSNRLSTIEDKALSRLGCKWLPW